MANLNDIAIKAGVNISTVSRALKGSLEIKSETRNKIVKIANELNYNTNKSKKVMSDLESCNIGLICPEVKSNFYGLLVNTIEENLKVEGFHLIIGLTNFKFENGEYYLDLFFRRRVAGIIFITSLDKRIEEELELFKAKCDIPLIQVDTKIKNESYDYIEIDDYKGIANAIEHLVKLGHKKICYLGDNLSKERIESFVDTLTKNDIGIDEDFIRIGEERFEEGGYLRMKEIFSLNKPVTAVFAAYDDIAIGAMRAIYEKGLKIPEDISVIGVDNIRVTGYLYNRLTTISEPVHEMGVIAAKILVGKIADQGSKTIQHVKLIPELIIRDTTGRVNQQE